MSSWENQFLENMEITVSASVNLWKYTIYFILLQLLVSSAKSMSDFWYSVST